MNIERRGALSIENHAPEEAEPVMPTDPDEAASWLHEMWKGHGGWDSRHPVQLKVKEPKDYRELSEEEKEQFDRLGGQFSWLAEMHRSEMSWSQSYARTNQGEVIGFRFGYDAMPENSEDYVPTTYVFKPFDEGMPDVVVSKGRDGWKIETLKEVAANYEKNFDY